MENKLCVLDDNKVCDDCCECEMCDLNPDKICDNCAKCLDLESDYRGIAIDEIIFEDDDFDEKLPKK